MRAVIQRVASASVTVDGLQVATIGRGLLVLLGVASADGDAEVQWITDKIAALRIFPDQLGRMQYSIIDERLEVLVVSQFTLYGDVRKGNRPSFTTAAPAQDAEPIYEQCCARLASKGIPTQRGVFGADMQVSLINDGPVTLVIDSHEA